MTALPLPDSRFWVTSPTVAKEGDRMGINVSLWKCECGVQLKAVTGTDEGQAPVSLHAKCPKCGHERTLSGNEILSVSEEKVS